MRPRSKLPLSIAFVVLACVAPLSRSGAGLEGGLEYLGRFTPDTGVAGFGGLSAIEVSADGKNAWLVSDRTALFEVSLTRTDRRISGLEIVHSAALRRPDGSEFPGDFGDSEGLARRADGRLLISFEGAPGVIDYSGSAATARAVPAAVEFAALPRNRALEAIAIDGDGTVYTLPEDTVSGRGAFPVFRLKDKIWTQPFVIPRDQGFLPVGADFGPDGGFYLLERRFRGLFGFETRIRRFQISGDEISPPQTLLTTPPGRHGNLEGIALWRDTDGRIRVILVADNNFFPFQVTELVEYLLP